MTNRESRIDAAVRATLSCSELRDTAFDLDWNGMENPDVFKTVCDLMSRVIAEYRRSCVQRNALGETAYEELYRFYAAHPEYKRQSA